MHDLPARHLDQRKARPRLGSDRQPLAGEKAAVVARAFLEVAQAEREARRVFAINPILQGGWRLSPQQALDAMQSPAAKSVVEHSGLRVSVCCVS